MSVGEAGGWPCLKPRAGGGCTLDFSIVPHARHTGADGLHDGALRLRVAAPPLDGRANRQVCEWVAEELHCPRRAVRVGRGATSRRKQLEIDVDAAVVAAWLATLAARAAR